MQRPAVRVTTEGEAGDERVFTERFCIGREEDCAFRLNRGLVSREHAEVAYEQGRWVLRDLKSTNGTYVDGERIGEVELRDGLTANFGKNGPTLRFHVDPVPEAPSSRPPAAEGQPTDRSAASDPEASRDEASAEEAPSASPAPPPQARADLERPRAGVPPSDRTAPSRERASSEAKTTPPPSSPADVERTQEHDRPEDAPPPAPPDPPGTTTDAAPASASSGPESTSPSSRAGREGDAPRSPGSAPLDPSVSQVIARYFEGEDHGPVGDRTMMIRQAYQSVKKKERRRYGWIIGAVALLALAAVGYAVYQHLHAQRLEAAANSIFYQMKEQEMQTAQIQKIIEETGGADLEEQLEEIRERQDRLAARYDGYIEELGLYRRMSEEEKLIFQTARIFNESEFGMPAGFVRRVRETIRDYWQGPGRSRFSQSIRTAQDEGYVRHIVQTMNEYGLPPEFFYLALQESNFNRLAVGPETRWGIAKGMWQFIPSTAERYGLQPGPRADIRTNNDPQDDRFDFRKSTTAAAKYLRDIYSTPAQASGLLVIASYNWGEHRVINKLEQLPGLGDIEELDLPRDPEKRNYWRFLTEYSERMPEETKDYVLKIFSAAVIGQNPRLFGFDFDNPLEPYMEQTGEIASTAQPTSN